MASIQTVGNRLTVSGRFELQDLRRFTAALYSITSKLGYEDVVIDFGRCTGAYAGPMAAACCEASALRNRGIEVGLVLPSDMRLGNFFRSNNWAHFIDPIKHGTSSYRGFTNIPLLGFTNGEEQTKAVDRLIDALLSSLPELERGDFAAIEWSLNEITDNVLVHSQSPVGGFVQMSTYRHRRHVEFSVVDAGHGIPRTLRQGHPELGDDAKALERAIREGVTRDPKIGQGNGLFGTFEVTRASGGTMHIQSGHARLSFERDELRYANEDVPFHGALVTARMNCSDPASLGKALKFGDKLYSPLDYIDTHYENASVNELVLRMADEVTSFGSRQAGEPLRVKLGNLIHMNPRRRISVDLSGVSLVSSSFADEVFGKLFVALGPLRFSQALELRGVSETVQALIDRAITQRMSLGSG